MTVAPSPAALLDIANSLEAAGRKADAVLLVEHLASVYPKDAAILRRFAKLRGDEGRTLEAIEALCRLKAIVTDSAPLLEDIRQQMTTAGDIEQAERCAGAMATLLPGNSMLLEAAMSCNVALGRNDKAAKFAEELILHKPDHVKARALLAATPKCPSPPPPPPAAGPDRPDETYAVSSPLQALGQLRDKHDAASEILCNPLNTQSLQELEKLLNAARAIDISLPAGTEWALWATHYRLMIDAMDIQALQAPTPDAGPEPTLDFASSSGASLTWNGIRNLARRTKAQTVFLAAADRAYVDLYAPWYVKSFLKHTDVPSLVILHVIGGGEELADIAKSLGIQDKRFILSGDRFDATAVTTKCYDGPPKSLAAKPIAHLQSARFLIAGAFLQNLKLPLLISDIDCVLQRGVADLLQRCADADVVLNEHTLKMQAGSRFTANLLLVNPTDNGSRFLRFLRSFLENHLSRPEVSRWIDQFGLMLGRHHLPLHAKDARIEYFDTWSDINNVMYPSYQQNPFRFLSLYHGFDMSSLERTDALGGDVPAKKQRASDEAMSAAKTSAQGRKEPRERSTATG